MSPKVSPIDATVTTDFAVVFIPRCFDMIMFLVDVLITSGEFGAGQDIIAIFDGATVLCWTIDKVGTEGIEETSGYTGVTRGQRFDR